jgi:proteic killer suppression protein
LEVRYKDNKLEKLCTNEREMQRRRPDIQKKLRLRINALRTAATVGDLPRDDPGGAWHELKGDLAGIWSGELSGNWRLLVEPDPLRSLGAVVATVIDIDDYH